MITIKYITPTNAKEGDVFDSIRDRKSVTLMSTRKMKPEDVKRLFEKVKRTAFANDCRIFSLDDNLFLITPPTIEIPSTKQKQAKSIDGEDFDDFDYPEERIPKKNYAQRIKPTIEAIRESAEKFKIPSKEAMAKILDYKTITSNAPKNDRLQDLEELKRLVMGKAPDAKVSYPVFNFRGMKIAKKRRKIISEMAAIKDLANGGKINKKTFEKIKKQLAEELDEVAKGLPPSDNAKGKGK